jgi:photosynthetic reaction center cytochrome c subunit
VNGLFRFLVAAIALVAVGNILAFVGSVLFRSERPPVGTAQLGSRGTGMVQIYNPRDRKDLLETNQVPPSVPYAGDEGPKARTVYENVQVLGDVSVGEFTRLMVNMTSWVAPTQGCAACHDLADLAKDTLYTKVVARRMLEMTRHINANWTQHVGRTGVTCYTCHRGRLVPAHVWFGDPGPKQAGGVAQRPAGQNHPTAAVGGSALPLDPFTPFLLDRGNGLRVQSTTALPTGNRHSIKQAEWTYALMMHFSQALGVNCDYCHNTRSLADWSQSPRPRVTAWHGIRMARELNDRYLDPLGKLLPPSRLGAALGDAPKVNCATCHNGVFKPLFGAGMAQGFPDLTGPAATKPRIP